MTPIVRNAKETRNLIPKSPEIRETLKFGENKGFDFYKNLWEIYELGSFLLNNQFDKRKIEQEIISID